MVVLCVGIGLYPFSFLVTNAAEGFMKFKGAEFIPKDIWHVAFYIHILLGGIALLIGWTQFPKKFRAKNLSWHRTLGKVYIVAILFSGFAGLYMAVYANGGIVPKLGFGGMAISWLATTVLAYTSIRKKAIKEHQKWMIRSYAVTLAGVTFRLWLPLFLFVFDMNFNLVYSVDSWISWVLNLVFAEILISKIFAKSKQAMSPA